MEKITILTGAGISAESGLGTFRDVGGLWDQYDLEEVATPEGFARNPALVHEFYNARRANCLNAQPNAAHFAIARLQQEFPGQIVLVTQNIDNLHERTGASDVWHMHGELMQALCAQCGQTWPAAPELQPTDLCPHCNEATTRPDIVWFGETPYHMEEIWYHVETAGLFVAIGTSGQVYPAAAFAQHAGRKGARRLELNLEPSDNARDFDQAIYGPASTVVSDWVDELLSG